MRRQGDILFIKVEGAAKMKAKKKVKKDGVIALGEKTGHMHKLEGGKLYESFGRMYITVTGEAARVTHNEHNTITLPRGEYIVRRQREFDGFVRD